MFILICIISPAVCLYLLSIIFSQRKIFNLNLIENREYVLIFGAGLNKNGIPSDILQDRLNAGIALFNIHKVNTLFLSGACANGGRNETSAMVETIISAGIPETHILVDRYGFSTLASLINFSEVYPNSKVILLTQRFHLPRALTLSGLLGMDAIGCIADTLSFSRKKRVFWSIREIFAFPYNLLKFVLYKILNT